MKSRIAILFQNKVTEGQIQINYGNLTDLKSNCGCDADESKFCLCGDGPFRLEAAFVDVKNDAGAYATRISVKTVCFGFTFFLRDVNSNYPIYIPQYGVAVTCADDLRAYSEIAEAVVRSSGMSELEKIEAAPETTYERSLQGLRKLDSPTWLGLARDIRIFEVGIRDYCAESWDSVSPKFFSVPEKLPELGELPVKYCFMAGRGIGCEKNITRRLEDGVLPIVNAANMDADIIYNTRYFVTNEVSPLDASHVRGTDMYIADLHGAGHMLTREQQAHADSLCDAELFREDETVMYIRVEAVNTSCAPRYSFVRIPDPLPGREHARYTFELPHYDGETGFGILSNGKVFLVATLNGKPVPQEEMSVLIQPGEKIEYVFKIPHAPIDKERASALALNDYSQRFTECKQYWQAKLNDAARISVPETRIDEMIRAGLLHIDVAYFGLEPDQPVVPIVGVYTAIGSESSPGIQFLDSMAKTQLAERALQFFVEKQHDDGFMQNFGGYMLETGFALWSMGEHYRYGAGVEWARSVAESVKKACEYTIRWRAQSLGDELKNKGYGMIDGKVADPNDLFHSFMLNSGAYAGFVAAAEILEKIDPEAAAKYGALAAEHKQNIRESLTENMALSPVVPLGNGCWVPSVSPWTEYPGALSLYAEGGKWYSHATSTIRDILNVQYLMLHGVVDPRELEAEFILNYFADFLCARNVAFSQPYYSPHVYSNLQRGEVKAFLSEFYNGFASLSDRGTYSFWEHYHHASPHKLHEETWFLMRCRWMLYLEDGSSLKLLPGVPRAWLEDGKTIYVDGVKSHFGTLSYRVDSMIGVGRIKVSVSLEGEVMPDKLIVRIPHPCEGKKAVSVSRGYYDAAAETITLSNFTGQAEIEVVF
jgi:hypothetical protein